MITESEKHLLKHWENIHEKEAVKAVWKSKNDNCPINIIIDYRFVYFHFHYFHSGHLSITLFHSILRSWTDLLLMKIGLFNRYFRLIPILFRYVDNAAVKLAISVNSASSHLSVLTVLVVIFGRDQPFEELCRDLCDNS